MERLTKTYSDGTHGASDSLPCGENSYDYKNLLIEKLGKYEDLEERLNKIYGECEGLLESMIELLEEHSGVDVPDDTIKALLLINESVDFYKKCESLEKQGRLVKLPCKVGDVVYVKMASYCKTHYIEAEVRDFVHFISCGFCAVVTSKYFDKENIPFSEFGKTIFLTKEEVEAKLKELRGGEDGSME